MLQGAYTRLEPLTLDHVDALASVGLEPSLWSLTLTEVASVADMHEYVRAALAQEAGGAAMPFAIIDRASNRVVGSTRYLNVEIAHARLEIGSTWVAGPWQRTAINTEAKRLLLAYAFETLEAARVEFKTDVLNVRSRQALARIGAVEEGVLRQHMITSSGRTRDSVYFSILKSEWSAVRTRLDAMLIPGS